MISEYDESLMHQVGHTLDHAGVSDHRFFDRMWLGGHCADNIKFISGIAAYKNTNAFDGFFCLMKDGRQHNVRATRRFRPRLGELSVGPLSYDFVRPLQEVKVILEVSPDFPISGEVIFTGRFPAYEEDRHFNRVNGAIVQDYVRYDQIGRLDGHFVIEGERVAVNNWFGARDHSWGTRLRMGGYDPDTFGAQSDAGISSDPARGNLWLWLGFDAGNIAGQMQRVEDGHGNIQMVHGHVLKTGDPRVYSVVSIDHEIEFVPGTRVYRSANITAKLNNGEVLHIAAQALLSPWVYKGAGYDNGYDDELGLGICRGETVESESWNVSDPELVILSDGREIRPAHREQPVMLTVNGQPGLGHMPVINRGAIATYGLHRAATNMRADGK